ncbi:MAG: CehA/McbA family metallohydrolase [Lentihominibacter sp.]|jgi:predicted metal-dependent phosphoesterase TrpH
MKFDLHCHTKEGSFDAKVTVREYAEKFMELGFDGFMITDHNSFRGCQEWDRIKDEPQYREYNGGKGLTVLQGIEYDTKDAGHMLVVLPDGVYLPLLKMRGMRCKKLISFVHSCGGILGLAHPFGVPSSSAMGFKLMNEKLIRRMDFIEVFNTCETPVSNKLALELAEKYGLPGISGSDSHVADYIGSAYTEFSEFDITCNNDLIAAIKGGHITAAIGVEREETKKARVKGHWISQLGYRAYNRGLGKVEFPFRRLSHHNTVHKGPHSDKFSPHYKRIV